MALSSALFLLAQRRQPPGRCVDEFFYNGSSGEPWDCIVVAVRGKTSAVHCARGGVLFLIAD
eukprot:12580972-Alexandrium_andersonii.AAC.1